MFNKLMTPLLYLRIRHSQKKYYDWIIPFVSAAILTGLFIWIDPTAQHFKKGAGIQKSIVGLLQMLAGFFIAALSVIATFNSPIMDKKMSGQPPTLKHKSYPGELKKLSRRRFLAFMFGYLSFSTILLYLTLVTMEVWLGLGTKLFQPSQTVARYSTWAILFVFVFWFMNILVTTFLGLHYLTERIHRVEQQSGPASRNKK